jgi:putative membrane protein
MRENPEPYKKLIIGLSIVIPVAVAALFGLKIPGYDLSFLPPIYASINGLTAIVLVV